MHWLTAIFVPLTLAAVWLYTLSSARMTPLRNQRITLLIAHPDDEAMFFSPTLLALTKAELNNTVQVICLSSGDADGLGEIRKKELVQSCRRLGIKADSDVTTIEHKDLQDSMTATWPASTISSILFSIFPTSSPPTVIITFDDDGISSHPNHISCLNGARDYIHSISPSTTLYTLTSVPLLRKYLSIFDGPISLMSYNKNIDVSTRGQGAGFPEGLLFVNTPTQTRIAQKAMTHAHVSQMRWFRWGWIGLSRYMVLNDLVLERVV